jgi:hypothetical protein
MTELSRPDAPLGPAEVRDLAGDIDDRRVVEIVALRPSREELEEAIAWVAGGDDEMHRQRKPLTGTAAAIYELLVADLPDDDLER